MRNKRAWWASTMAILLVVNLLLPMSSSFALTKSTVESTAAEVSADVQDTATETPTLEESPVAAAPDSVDSLPVEESLTTESRASEALIPEVVSADDTAVEAASLAVPEPSEASVSSQATESYAQPTEDDFEFSAGVISKLKKSYVEGLTAEQKADVRLIIPAQIKGIPVTALASSAFYSYTYPGLTYTYLDLSQADSLVSIGSNAFRYASKLTGDLILPDSLEKLGESAFANCGYTGILHLPNNAAFTAIPGQAFLDTRFTGTLDIPMNVITVGRKSFEGTSFSGSLKLHEGLEEVYASAFAGCIGLTSVVVSSTVNFKVSGNDNGHHFRNCTNLEEIIFPENSSMTRLYSEMFGGCTKLKKLDIPDSVKEIDAKAFYSCGLQTVYLPKEAAIVANAGSFLFNCVNPVAVCQDKASYDAYKAQFPATQQKYLGYPITVSFDAGESGSNPQSESHLFNQAFNRVFDEGTQLWTVNSSYSFPLFSMDPGLKTAWYINANKTTIALESTVISVDPAILYSGNPLPVDPTFTYQEIDKVYDGETAYLKAEGSHPLATNPETAKVGDYALYYAWVEWDYEKQPNAVVVQQGFSNTLGLKEVADSKATYTQFYTVQAYLYQRTETSWKKVLGAFTQRLTAQITPAKPTVHAQLSTQATSTIAGLPGLELSADDTAGTLLWDAGQIVEEGVHTYHWTFTPDAVEGKAANYQTTTGSMELRVVGGKVVQSVSFETGEGSRLDSFEVEFGSTIPENTLSIREGYVFAGWYEDAGLTKPWRTASAVIADLTLHAKWVKRAGSIDVGEEALVVNGNPVDISTATVDLTLKPEVSSEDKGALEEASLPEGETETVGFFELNLVLNGLELSEATLNRALPVTIALPVVERTRYKVAHLKHDGTTELLDAVPNCASGTLSFEVTSFSPFMVVAQKLYQVDFETLGGSEPPETLADVPAGTGVATPQNPTKEGYTFQGWTSDPAGELPWVFESDTVLDDTVLYAQWAVNIQSVSFDTHGGVAINPLQVNYGDTLPVITADREGYTFAGWYTDATLATPWTATDLVKADMTLHAKWTAVEAPAPVVPEAPAGGSEGEAPPESTLDKGTPPATTSGAGVSTDKVESRALIPATGDEFPLVAMGLLAILAAIASVFSIRRMCRQPR